MAPQKIVPPAPEKIKPPVPEKIALPAPDETKDLKVTIKGVARNDTHLVMGQFDDGSDADYITGLRIDIRITNLDQNHLRRYRTWRENAMLEDEFGNKYDNLCGRKRFPFLGGPLSSARWTVADLYPGDTDDTLIFQLPIRNAKTLTLTCPGENLGLSGRFRFTITDDRNVGFARPIR